jgi:hypothetical protein
LLRKRKSHPETAETTKGVENVHLEPQHHEGKIGQARHHQANDIEEGYSGDDAVRDMEYEGQRKGVTAQVPI